VRLLRRVFDDPEDEAARLVLIDHLLEVHDPRGEYLHLAERLSRARAVNDGTLSIEEIERMNELLTRHEDQWLGPLAHVTSRESRRYFRGYLDVCDLALDAPADLDGAIGAPEWSTLSRIERSGKARASDLSRLVLATPMPRLRALGPLDQPTIAELRRADATPRSIEEVSFYVINPKPDAVFSQELLHAMERGAGLPNLKRLFVGFIKRTPNPFQDTDVILSWLWKTPAAKHLEVIGVALESHLGLARWMASIEAHETSIRELRILPATAVGPPSLLHTTPGDHITVARGDGDYASRFTKLTAREVGYQPVTELPQTLAQLPEDALTHVDLRNVSAWRTVSPALLTLEKQRNLKELILPKAAYGYGGLNEQRQATQMLERLRLRDVRVTYIDPTVT